MTNEQYRLYTAAMHIGRAFGVGGGTWTYWTPSAADNITGESTLTSSGTIKGYVVQERLANYGQPLPAQPVGIFQWRFVGAIGQTIAAGAVISSGTLAFSFSSVDLYQGFPTGILEVCAVPTSASTGGGYRSPLWILGLAA